jgi:hypothetical protein
MVNENYNFKVQIFINIECFTLEFMVMLEVRGDKYIYLFFELRSRARDKYSKFKLKCQVSDFWFLSPKLYAHIYIYIYCFHSSKKEAIANFLC